MYTKARNSTCWSRDRGRKKETRCLMDMCAVNTQEKHTAREHHNVSIVIYLFYRRAFTSLCVSLNLKYGFFMNRAWLSSLSHHGLSHPLPPLFLNQVTVTWLLWAGHCVRRVEEKSCHVQTIRHSNSPSVRLGQTSLLHTLPNQFAPPAVSDPSASP